MNSSFMFLLIADEEALYRFITKAFQAWRSNEAINDNLSRQIMSIYKDFFGRSVLARKPLDDLFYISIGRTPPRKEFNWFTVGQGIKWASVSSLGSCGVYLRSTPECLTNEAVEKFRIPVIPENTVLLSFKLTVGRVAITGVPMCTNEAIASFNSKTIPLNLYLYCFLKDFKYESLGSTSSIATAVNSKIIRKILLPLPGNPDLQLFNSLVNPIFQQIRTLEDENDILSETRDSLIPKLMNL